MPFTEDMAAFFDVNEHGIAATYNGSTSVDGIFNEPFVDVFAGEGVGVSSTAPEFLYDPAALSAAVGATLLVAGVTYTVQDIEITNGLGRMILEVV